MAQILDPIPQGHKNSFLCCYVNATSQIQIVRISNVANWYFERVVFPGQRLVFEALPKALLEIHTGMMASAILSDTIPCERLCIDENDTLEDDSEPILEADSTNDLENLDRKIERERRSIASQGTSNINTALRTAISYC